MYLKMPAPKADSTNIMVRVNQDTTDQIDALVSSGRFKDRVDVVRTAIDRLLNEDRSAEAADRAIRERLLLGGFDAEIEERMRALFSRIIVPPDTERR